MTLLQDGGSDLAVPQVTPTMFAVTSGRYRARFELESFPAQERSIEVAPGGALTPVMVPWDTGEVRLESVQEGVRIELFAGAEMTHGGSPLVEFTLPRHEPVRLPPGVYSLIAQLKGHARRYYERAEAVHVSAGHTVFKTVWLRPFRALFQVSGERLLSVSAAADLDGDGLLEILAPAEGGLDVLGSDGSRRFAVPTSGKITKALAADLDGDGSQEVIVAENRDGSRARISCVGSDGAPRCQTTFDEPILDVAAIDFHGDGEPLVVVSLAHDSQHPARVDCLSADGSSLWQRPLDSDAMQLVAVDQDGDGRTEVIAVGGGEAGVLLGLDASGSECLKAHVGGRVKSCQAVDLDGDGAQELVVRIENGGFVVFDGTGAERFARRRGNLVQLILRDLDGDGRTEVIGAERSDSVPPVSYVFAMTADAMTRFRTEIHDYCHELYIGDFGEPTSTEIAFQGTYISPVIDSHGAIVYSRSDGEDKFSRRPPDFSLPTLVSDVDGDGRSEVIGTPGSQIVIQDYQGRVISEIAMPQVLRQLATYDLDGNGVSEIVALSVDGTLTAYGLDPDQEWAVEMLPPEPEIVALMTYCARGSTAVVALSAGGRIAAFGSNGTKLWEHDEPHLTDTGDHSLHMRTLTVADCDQDGQPDIVAGMKDVIVGLHADGEKTFEVPVAGRVLDLVTLDLDRSRRRPVLVAAIDQNVWALVVAINADTSPRFEVKLSCVELATLPLDQDGPCRLLAVTFDARIVAIDEHGFAKALIDPKVDEIKGLSVADLDGDRRADLIFGVVGRDQRPLLTAWHQDGSQLFATPVDAKIIVTSVVDLDHDERPEIIAGTESGLVILRTDGSILFSRTTHAQVIDLAAVDLDDDGVAEVVAADWQGRISAFTLAGKLVWSTPMRSRVKRLLAADLDGDRHQELIAGDGSGIIATYAPRLKKRVR
ncbi:MAG: VCBS repeat-containing protein [Planctomycetota bacterium]